MLTTAGTTFSDSSAKLSGAGLAVAGTDTASSRAPAAAIRPRCNRAVARFGRMTCMLLLDRCRSFRPAVWMRHGENTAHSAAREMRRWHRPHMASEVRTGGGVRARIGRESWREEMGQSGEITVGG